QSGRRRHEIHPGLHRQPQKVKPRPKRNSQSDPRSNGKINGNNGPCIQKKEEHKGHGVDSESTEFSIKMWDWDLKEERQEPLS
ncbi:MAG: hypothetical protein AAFQ98_27175, partial [Bacteroidota bacterium]